MQKAKLSWLFIVNIFLLITAIISLAKPNLVQSATASHVVISEIQIGLTGDGANEFIELYNPTGSAVNISGWKLTKKTAAADPATSQVLFATVPASTSIASHGYYLIAHTDYLGITEDLTYNDNPVSASNTVYLKNGSDAVIDKVGLGDTNDAEGTAKGNPPTNGSIERKANSTSTNTTMQTGVDVSAGNGEDTDDNALDFINRTAPDPQNAASATENPTNSPAPSASSSPSASASASPSASASALPSASPSASASATPTPSASASASPSVSPSATPTPTPSASPSATPSVSPSVSPSATPTPSVSPSATPTATPTPSASASPSTSPTPSASASATPNPSKTPKPTSTPKPRKTLVCEFKPQTLKFGRFEITFHIFDCDWIVK